ncbi:uncharacterized protein OCT59_004562 [Rhizophagus irregularis]|uniref:Uncharacterized protein n=2 Tax=Rhizophagus irregularis TaxID=588596 RepID=A0A015N6Y2_RHIIW|nr:hypothetical protein GLOIN_2v1870422 [Rhizophagus irregularis DAOM 181602=DAOM 197198]EXX74963.1 hypothetical protein RirG_046230 [Rhizophagus irregularis DAOM 197198w]UZO13056.1 hypothetical protein OCT59_004562 [Rhizophagus irregularis]POG78615.1 hypothetical protein GLOIN_2v1870422 [Rhizophagus irregularis DAOM 181602=DAOM 197198]CAG8631347.1 7787_t:CDS:1 [Rhizophagus irregularis]GBC54446.1 hypothetical protein GLOIN_2v1870422 [Rhizophagus irregularis DAOM 181602=DAOM 197198]|eukprot:XP_025185481.1 hypothetical protein GLOIN_2v1870422 [Rhizophagus irregularis DAOM 181602=DAOM 197198]
MTERDVQREVFNLLKLINEKNIRRLPYNDAKDLATQMRNDTIFTSITGKEILKQNMKYESHLNNQYDQPIIDLATDVFWNTRLSNLQRNQFTNLANDANVINEIHFQASNDAHFRMSQLYNHQQGTDNDIFNGIRFY